MSVDDEWDKVRIGLPKQSKDPIPAEGIWLSDAFDLVFKSKTPNWQDLYNKHCVAFEDESWDIADGMHPDLNSWYTARGKAERIFRTALENGDLIAYIHDLRTGETLQLAPEAWQLPDSYANWYVPRGINSNYVGDAETPGPTGTIIDGAYRPVFLLRAQFEDWFRRQGLTRSTDATIDETLSHTGGQGRPSSRKIVELKLDRRLQAGEFKNTKLKIGEIAKLLSGWLTHNYRYHPKMTAKAIENVFREKIRLIVNSQKTPK
jgi:hypothetical protein